MAVLSTEINPVVGTRCRKLGIRCVQDVGLSKIEAFHALLAEYGVAPDTVAYVGNNVNDLGPLASAGVPIVVADARPEALAAAGLTLSKPGGRGAVRELSDLLLSKLTSTSAKTPKTST